VVDVEVEVEVEVEVTVEAESGTGGVGLSFETPTVVRPTAPSARPAATSNQALTSTIAAGRLRAIAAPL
jgi:hypothetical protein